MKKKQLLFASRLILKPSSYEALWFSIRENAGLAIDMLNAHKFRTSLTVLSIFIGVLVVIMMASVLNGIRQAVLDQAESFGTHNVYIWRFPFIPTESISPEVLKRRPLTLEDAKAVEQEVKEVEYAYAGLMCGLTAPGEIPPPPFETRYRSRVTDRQRVIGNSPVAELVMNVPIAEGRYFTDAENEHRAFVCVLAFNMVEALFPAEDPVNKTIKMAGHDFTVVGTIKKQRAGPFGSENPEDNDILIPYWTHRKIFPHVDDHFIVIRMREGQLRKGIERVEQVLRQRRNLPLSIENDFAVGTPELFIGTFDDLAESVKLAMLAISSISFIVGGVGVMNIMLVAVTERAREIGLRRAVGARRADIIWQFLIEAVVVSASGGILGLLVGWIIAVAVSTVANDLSLSIPIWASAFGLFGSLAVGLIFGLWPAVKAACLNPVVALHCE